jgi:hypothetical protein
MTDKPPHHPNSFLTRVRSLLRNPFSRAARKPKRAAAQEPFDPWLGNQTIEDDEDEEGTPVDLKRLSEIYVYGMMVVILIVCVLCYVFLLAPGSR